MDGEKVKAAMAELTAASEQYAKATAAHEAAPDDIADDDQWRLDDAVDDADLALSKLLWRHRTMLIEALASAARGEKGEGSKA